MADRTIYVGNGSNVAVEPTKIYIGDSNDTAQEVTKIYVGNVSNKAVQVWPRYKWSDIYQRCEYLYNANSTEYITTGIHPNSNTRIVIDAKKNNSENSNHDRTLCKTYGGYYGLSWYHSASTTSAGYIYYNFGSSRTVAYAINYSDWWNGRHTYDMNRNGGHMYMDSVHVGQSTATFAQMDGVIQIWEGSAAYYTPLKWYVYSFKAYQNDALIRDMWPCYRKSDYKPGMYDFANDVFYTNAGSGEFYKGPDVN